MRVVQAAENDSRMIPGQRVAGPHKLGQLAQTEPKRLNARLAGELPD